MRIRKIYRRFLLVALLINIAAILFFAYQNLYQSIPNNLKIMVNRQEQVNLSTITGGIGEFIASNEENPAKEVGAISINNKKLSADKIRFNLNEPLSIKVSQTGNFKINVKLFGWLPIKEVNLDVIEEQSLIPCGYPIGISIQTDGILVLGTGIIAGQDGLNYEPALNILKTGDYIKEIDGVTIQSKSDLMDGIQRSYGESLDVLVSRKEENIHVRVEPVLASDGEYKIGAWIRNDTQGIGTLTYMDKNGKFGALGHGITDIDTGILMKVREGGIYKADILRIIKGEKGVPGEIVGVINKSIQNQYGSIIKNTGQGIFGSFLEQPDHSMLKTALPIALKQEVSLGKAQILCQVNETIETYEIEIEEIEWNTKNESKGMVIHIVDEDLLGLTNGIIQGMSGSPIIQNGKFVGAVTHVFVQDSTRGYGIFVENMLKAAK